MLSEMLGELNVSHAGAGYRGGSMSNKDATASLGIFMNYDHTGNGILIDEIINGKELLLEQRSRSTLQLVLR